MNKYYVVIAVALLLAGSFQSISAQEGGELLQVEYPAGVAIDSDLDGLTDEGEERIFKTDPENPDTDGDGIFDGTEVIGKTDPLNPLSRETVPPISGSDNGSGTLPVNNQEAEGLSISSVDVAVTPLEEKEVPWGWFVSRTSGLVAFALLYFSILLGVGIRLPGLRRIFRPLHTLNTHCWLSLYALLFALVHPLALLFDKFLKFNLVDIFVPFARQSVPGVINSTLVALGIIGFYLMVILVATSYARKHLSQFVWRATHFTNIALYVLVLVHSFLSGTDLKILLWRNVFIAANTVLSILIVANLIFQLYDSWKRRRNRQLVSSITPKSARI